jgi:hypothetical protein
MVARGAVVASRRLGGTGVLAARAVEAVAVADARVLAARAVQACTHACRRGVVAVGAVSAASGPVVGGSTASAVERDISPHVVA